MSQSRVRPSGCAARQPATSAHIQHKTSGGSIVIRIVPTPKSGAAVTDNRSQKPARALTSRANRRNTITLKIAANNGEKKRTPKAVSPHNEVPANWISAMPGGLL